MILNSYAKLNLFLAVLNKRKDNYHNILTLFERINLFDTIILRKRKDKLIKVSCSDPSVPKDASNLCFRSAKLLQDKFNITTGVDIKIIKRIPVGAGLGGGSGNAATVLLGVNKLWRLGLPLKTLVKLGSKLGADVPFFVYGTSFALGRRRGDKIEPLRPLKGCLLWHVLAVPKLHVSTPFIYQKYDSRPFGKNEKAGLTRLLRNVKILIPAVRKKDVSLTGSLLFNSLEPVTLRHYPQVRRLKESFSELGLQPNLMSGSGPAVFSIVSSRRQAIAVSKRLQQECNLLRVFAVSTF